jgi:hypothetical protein
MALRPEVPAGEDLVQDFEIAATERLREARSLLARGEGTGAAYSAGYAAEMHLKQAVFRVDGARPHDRVRTRLNPAKRWAQSAIPSYRFRDYHDILFWALVLRKKRIDRGRPLSEALSQNLVRLATRLSRAWSVHLRYHGREVTTIDAKTVLEDVAWFEKNRFRLWS